MADVASFAIVLPCVGARAPSTPIWIPSDPRFANPQREYDAIVKARCDKGFALAWILCSSAAIQNWAQITLNVIADLSMRQIRFQLALSPTAARLGESQRWGRL